MIEHLAKTRVAADRKPSQNVNHMLIQQAFAGIQPLANTHDLLRCQKHVFTGVSSNSFALEEPDKREHGILNFPRHLKHLHQREVQINGSTTLIIRQLVIFLHHSSLESIGGRGINEILQPQTGNTVLIGESFVDAKLPNSHFVHS